MSARPLTKALHTVRVVENIAMLVLRECYERTYKPTPEQLFLTVLHALDNAPPRVARLRSLCLLACRVALERSR